MNGNEMLFTYYSYLEKYHREPVDFDDLIDGMQALSTVGKIEKYFYDKKGK